MSTRLRDDKDAFGRRRGETTWLGTVEGCTAAAAWEWTEYKKDVIVLSDPNAVQSNLRFLDEDNQELSESAAAVCLNRLIHVLPWQDAVCTVLRAVCEHPEVADRQAPAGEYHIGVRMPRFSPLVRAAA